MAGFEDIGSLLGLPANNEISYQKGLALGANTQNALQLARQRVRENTALEKISTDTNLAAELGLPPGLMAAVAGGIDPRQLTGAAGQIQERNFRATAGSQDPGVDAGARNRALAGVASGPVETFKAVGSKGYQDVFHPESGVMPLGNGAAGGGGDAAAIQILSAFGFLDPAGHVKPGMEKQAFDTMRSTMHAVDLGGVPGVIDANPFAHMLPPAPAGMPPAASSANMPSPASLGAELAPPAPVAAPPMLPPASAPAAPVAPVAGVGAAQPVSSAADVGANAAEIERQKVIGKGAGDASVALPDSIADTERLRSNIQSFLAKPGFDSVYGNIQGQPLVRGAMGVLSQDTANAQAALKNIDAQTFGIAVQKMRGLGQLSNAEGLKVTDAFSRATNPLISGPEARTAWDEVLTYLDAAEARANRKATLPGAGAPAPAAPAGGAVGGAYADPAKEARYQAWKAAQGK